MSSFLNSETGGGPVKAFLEHLEDLRRVLFRSAAVFAVLFGIALFEAPRMLALLKWPLRRAAIDPDHFLRAFTVTSGISLWMQTAFWGATVAAAPFLFTIWCAYLMPALHPRERRAVIYGLGFALALFLAGVAMAFFTALPAALRIMLDINAWMGVPVEFWTVNDYTGFCLKLMLAFGLTFELPAVMLVLGLLGLVTSRQLLKTWRHAIVIALIISAIITPTTDPVSQLLLAAPLLGLYALSVLLLYRAERRRARREAAAPSA